ncbi:hypothetical protein CF15_04260 [Pyrodictium occultum]|uniref:Uncharacterized protein n=1 Tax=Pyrodictium occultum TaxID=2309 RepID=A0A0V8RVD0_PYROC|nr:hypothetical protein [Pyrodictium occultum]KSW12006.1 hypothetical protein CF15_04260 [Pyrodictium occultum]
MIHHRGGLGLILPSPEQVASPSRALGLVGELARAVAYAHGLGWVAAPIGWWSRRLCPVLAGLDCMGLEEEAIPSVADEIVEVEADSARPRHAQAPGKLVLRYYLDTRRGRVLYLGRALAAKA